MTAERLSALDASFLAVEGPATQMHVGWVALLDPPEDRAAPAPCRCSAHIARRLGGARRYRQRLAPVPFGLHEPVWVDDEGFDPAHHSGAHPAPTWTRSSTRSCPRRSPRDRPLWEI